MILAIDVDAVVADLTTVWLKRYNQDYDDILKAKDITSWGIQTFVKPECGDRIFDYLNETDLYDDVKPVKDSLEAVKMLGEQFRIIFVTSATKNHMGRKLQWLFDYKFLTEKKNYVVAEDKSLIYASFLIDDYILNVRSFHGKGILFKQPWNINDKWEFVIPNWRTIINKGLL